MGSLCSTLLAPNFGVPEQFCELVQHRQSNLFQCFLLFSPVQPLQCRSWAPGSCQTVLPGRMNTKEDSCSGLSLEKCLFSRSLADLITGDKHLYLHGVVWNYRFSGHLLSYGSKRFAAIPNLQSF